MNQGTKDVLAMLTRTGNMVEAIIDMYQRQAEATEILLVQLLLSNGGSLPMKYDLYDEAASGVWELHEGNGKMWIEKARGRK